MMYSNIYKESQLLKQEAFLYIINLINYMNNMFQLFLIVGLDQYFQTGVFGPVIGVS